MTNEKPKSTLSTQSARFDNRELDTLRKAAELKQWSLSQLIRVGAYEKAVHILNADSTAAYPIRRLLESMAKQLFEPEIILTDETSIGPDGEFTETVYDEEIYGRFGDNSLAPTSLHPDVADELVKAILRLGSELGPMLSEEVLRIRSPHNSKEELLDPILPSQAPSSSPARSNRSSKKISNPKQKKGGTR